MGAPRRSLVAALAAGSMLLTGCAGVTADAEAAKPSASPSKFPSGWTQSPKLPPPEQDAAVTGALSKVAVPAPPGFVSPRGLEGSGRTGPFTARSYVRQFYGKNKELLKNLRLGKLRRGYHRYATTGGGDWFHVYLFESRDNYGATSLKSMLFGSMTAEPYEVRLIEDALGQREIGLRDDEGRRYNAVTISFVTGNVYAVVIVATYRQRLKKHTAFVEQLARLQRLLLRRAMEQAPSA